MTDELDSRGEYAELRVDLLAMFRAAIDAGDPERLTASYIKECGAARADENPVDGAAAPLLIAAAGKAAARMTAAALRELSARRLVGTVIVPHTPQFDLEHVSVAVAGHPLPDERGERATAGLCRLLAQSPGAPLLCLLSGGASSLLVRPRPPLTLADKVGVNDLLLRSGADIQAINTVRKHLSQVKGGGLLRYGGPRRVLTLMISDVVGDDPSVIGSGPTSADPTTFADAVRVLRVHDILSRVPDSVRALLDAGVAGRERETLKPGDGAFAECANVIIGGNRTALQGAAVEARRRDFEVLVESEALRGDTGGAAHAWLDRVEAYAAAMPAGKRWCAISGGETTVRVRGAGRGGRNQEFALHLVARLSGTAVAILSAGTDGIDGPTDAAGALVTGASAERATAAGLDPEVFLADNNSYEFFSGLGDLHLCGASGTNLMDIKIAVGVGPLLTAGEMGR